MQILDSMAHSDESHQRSVATCTQLLQDAKQHQPAPEDQPLIDQLGTTLDMQLKRLSGEFHLTSAAALPIWQSGIAAGEAYLLRAA